MHKFSKEICDGHLEFHKKCRRQRQQGVIYGLHFLAYTTPPNQQIGLKDLLLGIFVLSLQAIE